MFRALGTKLWGLCAFFWGVRCLGMQVEGCQHVCRGGARRRQIAGPLKQGLPREPKPWKFLGFPNSLYRDVIKDPKNFRCLGSLGSV